MNPWLRGLWDTIHFGTDVRVWQHLAEGCRQKLRSGWNEWGRGAGREMYSVDVYVWMFGVWPHWELHWHETLHIPNVMLEASVRCSFRFSRRHPFCFRMRWQLSLLVTSKEPWIIDFIAMLQSCSPTRRAIVETGNDKACAQMHNTHACTHTNKHTPNYKHRFATVKLQWRMMIS